MARPRNEELYVGGEKTGEAISQQSLGEHKAVEPVTDEQAAKTANVGGDGICIGVRNEGDVLIGHGKLLLEGVKGRSKPGGQFTAPSSGRP